MKIALQQSSNQVLVVVENASTAAMDAQDYQYALVGAPVSIQYVCQKSGSPSFRTDPQICESIVHDS